ncbi:HD domain-containing protein [Derxia lacustris]|uniref:HD domain-containing protein n=1 Tax=Derxia lacustris TaxID=764842 RepID=UPI00111BD63C|nr:phosphohydrolase [Derxia lacustris]
MIRDVQDILDLYAHHGSAPYGAETVSHLQHALQTATLAEEAGEMPEIVAACFLHDIASLQRLLPDGARSAEATFEQLAELFEPAVLEPIRLHVAAKRYLCLVEPDYRHQLSMPSQMSLDEQGGPMTASEAERFLHEEFAYDAVRLRRYDDQARKPDMQTLSLHHFGRVLDSLATVAMR